jgi:hypothetical protein
VVIGGFTGAVNDPSPRAICIDIIGFSAIAAAWHSRSIHRAA